MRLATDQAEEIASRAPDANLAGRRSLFVHEDGGSGEFLQSAHPAVPEHEHVPGLTDFARAIAFPEQGVG